MRRLLTWSLWLVAGALVINLGSLLLPHFHSVRGSLPSVVPTRAEPHTVVVEEVHPQSRNPGRVVARYTTVVRSDGSRVREMLAFQDDSTTPSSWVRELRLASGRTIDIDYLHGMRTTQQTNDPFLNEAPLEPKQRCLSSARGGAMVSGEFLGEGLVHGFRVFKLRHGSATSWHAPGLGCATLRARREQRGRVTSTLEAVSIVRGEPDGAWFAVSDRFAEVSPSTFLHLDPSSPEARTLDAKYFRHRPGLKTR